MYYHVSDYYIEFIQQFRQQEVQNLHYIYI